MRKVRLSRPPFVEPVINLTPLIDVVFVILIMFIFIAPLLELEQVELARGPGGEKTTAVQNSSAIVIHVREDNAIWYDKRVVTLEELRQHLARAHARLPHVVPQLFHDKKAQFGVYQEVKNAVEAAGYERMDLILSPG